MMKYFQILPPLWLLPVSFTWLCKLYMGRTPALMNPSSPIVIRILLSTQIKLDNNKLDLYYYVLCTVKCNAFYMHLSFTTLYEVVTLAFYRQEN